MCSWVELTASASNTPLFSLSLNFTSVRGRRRGFYCCLWMIFELGFTYFNFFFGGLLRKILPKSEKLLERLFGGEGRGFVFGIWGFWWYLGLILGFLKMGLGDDGLKVESWYVGKSRCSRKKKKKKNKGGCCFKLRFIGSCISSSSKVDNSISGIATHCGNHPPWCCPITVF